MRVYLNDLLDTPAKEVIQDTKKHSNPNTHTDHDDGIDNGLLLGRPGDFLEFADGFFDIGDELVHIYRGARVVRWLTSEIQVF